MEMLKMGARDPYGTLHIHSQFRAGEPLSSQKPICVNGDMRGTTSTPLYIRDSAQKMERNPLKNASVVANSGTRKRRQLPPTPKQVNLVVCTLCIYTFNIYIYILFYLFYFSYTKNCTTPPMRLAWASIQKVQNLCRCLRHNPPLWTHNLIPM